MIKDIQENFNIYSEVIFNKFLVFTYNLFLRISASINGHLCKFKIDKNSFL